MRAPTTAAKLRPGSNNNGPGNGAAPRPRPVPVRPRGSLVAGIDIGSTKICCFIARVEGAEPRILGIGHQVSRGLKGGAIVNLEEVSDSIWRHPNLVFGAIAIFVYVGAEVAIGSSIANYLALDNIGHFISASTLPDPALRYQEALRGYLARRILRTVTVQAARISQRLEQIESLRQECAVLAPNPSQV